MPTLQEILKDMDNAVDIARLMQCSRAVVYHWNDGVRHPSAQALLLLEVYHLIWKTHFPDMTFNQFSQEFDLLQWVRR